METKPYDLQSPESIAKEYGGDKRRIAQAAQLGVLDATAAVMAGMFIDRMRSAAALEQQPQPTVAQQVMGAPAAPAAPAGLGATAPAAVMPAAPMAAPPMGMASGGLYDPPYMNQGGLSELPLPAGMFDEPDDGSYAPGGIVAFAEGDEIVVQGERPGPESYYGNYADPELQMEHVRKYYNPKTEERDAFTKFLKSEYSPERLAARKKENMWMTLAELGANLAASKSGNFFGALGEAGAKALPGMAAREKELRAEKVDSMKMLVGNENMSNKDALDFYNLVQAGTNKYGEFDQNRLDRKQQEKLAHIQGKYHIMGNQIQAGAQLGAARINKEGYLGAANLQNQRLMMQVSGAVTKDVDARLIRDSNYQKLLRTNPTEATKYRRGLIRSGVNDYVTGFGGGDVEDLGTIGQ